MSTPLVVGTLLAVGALAVVLYPLFFPAGRRDCPVCGPRPESDAAYCSNCGRVLEGKQEPRG